MAREKEIGCTISEEEREMLGRALVVTKKKLATYIRDAVLEAARRDLSERGQPVDRPPIPLSEQIDKDAIAEDVARRALKIMRGALKFPDDEAAEKPA